MGVDSCLGTGAIQDHFVGFHLMTILTGQSHISKVWVIVLYQVSKCTFDVVLKITLLHWKLSFSDILLLEEKRGTNTWSRRRSKLFHFSHSTLKIKEFVLQYSLSPLEIGDKYLRFLFLLSKLEQRTYFSLSLLESWEHFVWFLFLFSKVENILFDFSFSSRNWGKEIQISLSPLEIGEIVFKFLFLFSIWLFCLSSTTGW